MSCATYLVQKKIEKMSYIETTCTRQTSYGTNVLQKKTSYETKRPGPAVKMSYRKYVLYGTKRPADKMLLGTK